VLEADPGRGHVEGEIVVEPISQVRERPLVEVEYGEEGGGGRRGGHAEVAPPD
jgi:hypothetical protein